MSLYTLTVDLLAKTGSFTTDMGRTAREADRSMKDMERSVNRAVKGMLGSFGGLAIGLSAGAIFGAAIRNTIQAEKEFAQLEAVLKSTGEAAGYNSMQMAKMATTMAQASTYSSVEIMKAQTRLLSYSGIVGKEFPRALQLAIDQSVRLGEDLSQSAETVGKALEYPAQGVAALTKQGFRFSEEQKKMLKALEDTNRLAEAQAMVMDVMEESYKDAAAAARGTFGGAMSGLKNSINDLLTGDTGGDGLRGAAAAVNDLSATLNDPAVVEGFGHIVSGAMEAVRWIAELVATTAGATKWLGDELAARMHGPNLDDPVRIGEALDRLQEKKEKLNESLSSWKSVGSRDGIRAQLAEIDAEETRLRALAALGEQMRASRAGMDTKPAAPGKPRPLPKIIDPKDEAAAKRAAEAAKRLAEQQAESMARYDKQAALAAATMAGPLQAAEMTHKQRLAELDAELRKGNITQAAANVLKNEATAALEKTTAALREQQKAPSALLDTMSGEIHLLGMTGQARELYRRQLENERDMREAINKATEAGATFTDEQTAALLRQARGWAETSIAVEEATANAQAWQHVIVSAASGAADMFADLFSGQIKSTKDFFGELKDIWKRGWWDILRTSAQLNFVNPLQKALAGMLTGQGYAGAGQGGLLGGLFGGGGGQQGGMLQTLGGWFGMTGGQQQQAAVAAGGPTWAGMGAIAGATMGSTFVAGGMPAGIGAGDVVNIGGQMYMAAGTKAGAGFLTSAGAPWLAAGAGALYGWQQGGDTTGKALGAAAYGAAGYGVMAGVGGAVAGSAVAGSLAAGLAAVPVVGWVALAAIVVDKISGGKLFGTSYQAQEISQTIGVGPGGGTAAAQVYETGQKSLFGGTKRRTRDLAPSDEMKQTAGDIYAAMEAVAKSVSSTLGIATVDVVSGSFKQVYDKKGKLISEGSTVLGRMYSESVEDFAKRLSSEQVIAAVGKIDAAASRIAQDWRHSAETLEAGAAFFMAAATDARNGMDLWSGIGLQGLTDFVTRMQSGEEALMGTYQRLAGLAGDYGTLMTDIDTQLLTGGLNTWQQQALAIERTYRQQAKSANDYAKALGLSGARAEDLAKIEELRAVNMGKLQVQMEAEKAASLNNLALSALSPLRDDQKLAEAMKQLQDAVAAGDIGAANSASQAALGFGRNLYASGRDYNALYGQVTGMIAGMQPGDLALSDGTSMGQLADTLDALPEHFSKAIFELASGMQKETTAATNEVRDAVNRTNELLDELLQETRKGVTLNDRSQLRDELNRRVQQL